MVPRPAGAVDAAHHLSRFVNSDITFANPIRINNSLPKEKGFRQQHVPMDTLRALQQAAASSSSSHATPSRALANLKQQIEEAVSDEEEEE